MSAIHHESADTTSVARTKLAIAIFAYNESAVIGRLVRSLAEQTIFARKDIETCVYVVANGCNDDTARVAQAALDEPAVAARIVQSKVHDLQEKGKPNSWNQFVHHTLDTEMELVLFLDADITMLNSDSCDIVVEALIKSPKACVAIDSPLKDVVLRENKTLGDKMIMAFTNTENDPTTSVTGQFYCARANVLRTIVMPEKIIGEDGFLRAMFLTENFTKPEDLSRLIHAKGASHAYETLTRPGQILHHQTRLTLGTIINIVLFRKIREAMARGQTLKQFVEEQNRTSPGWIFKNAESEWGSAAYRGIRRDFLRRRINLFKQKSLGGKIKGLPVLIAAMTVDRYTYWRALDRLTKGKAIGFW